MVALQEERELHSAALFSGCRPSPRLDASSIQQVHGTSAMQLHNQIEAVSVTAVLVAVQHQLNNVHL